MIIACQVIPSADITLALASWDLANSTIIPGLDGIIDYATGLAIDVADFTTRAFLVHRQAP